MTLTRAVEQQGSRSALRATRWRVRRALALSFVAAALISILAGASMAAAGTRALRAGISAFNRQAYARAAVIFVRLADEGDARAETYLGFMYAHGRGVPQNYELAAQFYRAAAEQGIAVAQYMLGLMYDKGQGVPQDYVLAYTWINLAVANARPRDREYWTRIRDAIGGKLSLAQLTLAQRLSVEWQPLAIPPPPP